MGLGVLPTTADQRQQPGPKPSLLGSAYGKRPLYNTQQSAARMDSGQVTAAVGGQTSSWFLSRRRSGGWLG